MKQITFSQYRKIDLMILCLLTALFEGIATYASSSFLWGAQPLALSVSLLMTCISMVRWGALAVLPSLVGAVAYCIASGAAPEQYVIYCLGSIFCLAAVPVLKKLGKENVRAKLFHRVAFLGFAYLVIALGRWLVSLFFELTLGTLVAFLFSPTDLVSLLFALLVFTVLKNTDGMIEDQKTYLFRLERERKEKEQEESQYP